MTSRTLKPTRTRNRAALDPSTPRRSNPAVINSIASTSATTIRITFGARVQKAYKPEFKAGAGAAMTVETATIISDTVIELVFSGTVAGTDLIVEEGDPGIRTAAGGFVPAGTYAIPTFP